MRGGRLRAVSPGPGPDATAHREVLHIRVRRGGARAAPIPPRLLVRARRAKMSRMSPLRSTTRRFRSSPRSRPCAGERSSRGEVTSRSAPRTWPPRRLALLRNVEERTDGAETCRAPGARGLREEPQLGQAVAVRLDAGQAARQNRAFPATLGGERAGSLAHETGSLTDGGRGIKGTRVRPPAHTECR
jgi:hypothetical protein